MNYSPSPTSVERGRVSGDSLPWVMDYWPSPISMERGRVGGVCLLWGIEDKRSIGEKHNWLETADRPARRAAGRHRREVGKTFDRFRDKVFSRSVVVKVTERSATLSEFS